MLLLRQYEVLKGDATAAFIQNPAAYDLCRSLSHTRTIIADLDFAAARGGQDLPSTTRPL